MKKYEVTIEAHFLDGKWRGTCFFDAPRPDDMAECRRVRGAIEQSLDELLPRLERATAPVEAMSK